MADENPLDYFDKNESTYDEIMKAMQEKPFLQKVKDTFDGITKPKDSGEYKMAKLQLQLWTAPFFAILGVVAMVTLLMILGSGQSEDTRAQIAEVVVPETVEDIEEPPPEVEIEPIDMEFEPTEFSDVTPVNVNVQNPVNAPLSAKPAPVNAVAIVKSPITMKGIYGSRTTGQIGAARAQYGGSAANEACVMRALRWLASKQNADGSWPATKPAMTGLALLTFLAHGETPSSAEFGPTVEKGIRYLVDSQNADGRFKGHDGNNYAHLIATYALCEAYTMTKVPMVKEAAEKALVPIVQGQHPNGGWDYKMAQTERDDTSYMGWAAQAIKAGHMAGDLEVPGLEDAFKLAPKGFLVNAHADGGFGYTGPSHNSGLTSVGVLCMQLMGQANDDHVKKSLNVMDEWVLGWEPDKNDIATTAIPSKVGAGQSQQYYAYYATQAMFQSGGERWKRWNKMMSDIYPKVQKIQSKETSGYVDHKGQPQEIGHWENGDANEDGGPFVMDTCLTTLQLEVYYRYLPTFKEVKVEDAEVVIDKGDDVDVQIDLF